MKEEIYEKLINIMNLTTLDITFKEITLPKLAMYGEYFNKDTFRSSEIITF
jgi:hypothetical protein